MKHTEYPLFPQPAVIMHYPDSFEKELNYIKSLPHTGRQTPTSGRISDNKYLLYEPEMKTLKNYFQHCLDYFTQEVLKSKQRVVISQSWSTLINKGEGFATHDHPNSMINGSFYFSGGKDTAPLGLLNNRKAFLYVDNFDTTKYNSDCFYIPPSPGQLVLFPNNLEHYVPEIKEDEERRGIAFNTFIIDKIGSENNMTEVDLEQIIANTQ